MSENLKNPSLEGRSFLLIFEKASGNSRCQCSGFWPMSGMVAVDVVTPFMIALANSEGIANLWENVASGGNTIISIEELVGMAGLVGVNF